MIELNNKKQIKTNLLLVPSKIKCSLHLHNDTYTGTNIPSSALRKIHTARFLTKLSRHRVITVRSVHKLLWSIKLPRWIRVFCL